MSQLNYDLNDENFLILAMKAYNNVNLALTEFESDIKRVKYIKRLINQYNNDKDLKERLILNHIIVLSNVFGIEFTTKLLFFKIEEKNWSILKVFLVYLNYLPDYIRTISGCEINCKEIPLDWNVVERLRKI